MCFSFNPNEFPPESNDIAYTEDIRNQMKYMTIWHYSNTTQTNEFEHIEKNFAPVREKEIPDDLPTLLFLATETSDAFGDWWLNEHKDMISNHEKAEVIILEGNHYLHWSKSKEMKEAVKEFLSPTIAR